MLFLTPNLLAWGEKILAFNFLSDCLVSNGMNHIFNHSHQRIIRKIQFTAPPKMSCRLRHSVPRSYKPAVVQSQDTVIIRRKFVGPKRIIRPSSLKLSAKVTDEMEPPEGSWLTSLSLSSDFHNSISYFLIPSFLEEACTFFVQAAACLWACQMNAVSTIRGRYLPTESRQQRTKRRFNTGIPLLQLS